MIGKVLGTQRACAWGEKLWATIDRWNRKRKGDKTNGK